MFETKKVIIKNDLAEIPNLHIELEELFLKNNISTDDLFKFDLVLEELITNIVSYGYEDKNEHQIEVEFSYNHPDLTIKITDDAKEFNPLLREDPDIDIPIEERKIGGLGIFLTKKMMDNVEYSRNNNNNILIISKKVNK